MSDGFLARVPDLSPALRARGSLQENIRRVNNFIGSLGPEQPESPLAELATTFSGLQDVLDIDLAGISTQLPETIRTVQNSLPSGTLEFVEAIDETYTTARDFLEDSAIAKEVSRSGTSLQEFALAAIKDLLTILDGHIQELTDNFIEPEALNRVTTSIGQLQEFIDDFPAHQSQLLPFISHNLMEIAPELLKPPIDHVNSVFAVFDPLSEEALTLNLNPLRRGVESAVTELLSAVDTLDLADASDYLEIRNRLDAVESAIRALVDAIKPVYQGSLDLIQNQSWDTLFSTYQGLLEAISFDDVFSVDDVVDEMVSVLEDLLARTNALFGVDDLSERVAALGQVIQTTFTASPLGQVRQTLIDFLEKIRQAIENVPTEEIQQTVEKMLAAVQSELTVLGISEIRNKIDTAFSDAEGFVIDNINEAFKTRIQSALDDTLSSIPELQITGLVSEITSVIDQVTALIVDVKNELDAQLAGLSELVTKLDELSFRPLSDEVIEEIDDIKERLRSINPNALSDAERLALKAALAVLNEVELDDKLVAGLKQGFDAASAEFKSLLNQIAALFERLHEGLAAIDIDEISAPVEEVLAEVATLIDQVNGKVLLNPVYGVAEQALTSLDSLSPGKILDPLQPAYDTMIAAVNRLDPDQWVAPLNALYARIDELISFVDITPLLDELDSRQRSLFVDIRDAIVGAADQIDLPEPLNDFYDPIRSLLEGFTDAIFGDPETELRKIALEFRTKVDLNTLFKPLDDAFVKLLDMIESVPPEDLRVSINTLREAIGVGLETLNPRVVMTRLRSGQERLADLAPQALLGTSLILPSVELHFRARVQAAPPEREQDIASTLAKFRAVFVLIDPDQEDTLLHDLARVHETVQTDLREKINTLDTAGAEQAYANLTENLGRVVPNFLRSPTPLNRDEILLGFHAMRPSVKVEKLERVVERFLQHLKPMESALEPTINTLFDGIRETLMLISPLAIKDSVEGIYEAIRAKLRILDPDALAKTLRDDFLTPLTEPLEAVDPSQIRVQLDAAYNRVIEAVSNNLNRILDNIAALIDEKLRTIRAQLKQLIETFQSAIETALKLFREELSKFEQFLFADVMQKLRQVTNNLGESFDQELDRVHLAFDEMLAAIPLGNGT